MQLHNIEHEFGKWRKTVLKLDKFGLLHCPDDKLV